MARSVSCVCVCLQQVAKASQSTAEPVPVVSSVVPCCSADNGLGGLNRVVTSKAAAEIQVPVHYCCMINRWGHGEWPTPLLEWYRLIISTALRIGGTGPEAQNEPPTQERARRVGVTKFHS